MAQSKSPPKGPQKVATEPGFEKRLANMYKKALNTPPKHVSDKRTKPNKGK